MSNTSILPDLDGLIFTVRGQPAILDHLLARLYEVPTFRFNEAIKRNTERFPNDFRFQLSAKEWAAVRAQHLAPQHASLSSSQIAMSSIKTRAAAYRPWVFTEHGAIMAATVLKSRRAVAMSVYVVRAFVRLRRELQTNAALEARLAGIEKGLLTHDTALRDLYAKLKPLLLPPPDRPRREIGFHTRIEKNRPQGRKP
jgi:hypothetical protein